MPAWHNKALHNIFGITHAGKNNIAFPSYEVCVDFWERNYGSYAKKDIYTADWGNGNN
jgi:hypothetical protein